MATDEVFDAMLKVAREAGAVAAREAEKQFKELLRREVETLQRTHASQLRTIDQIAMECPAFSKSTLYKMVAEAESNGLEKEGVILRPGGRPLIHRQRFDAWIEKHRKPSQRGRNGKSAR